MVTTPELVAAATADLAGIGSAVERATSSAAEPTIAIAAAAADEVSAAIAQAFGSFGTEFQALNGQAVKYHSDFVRLLARGAEAYLVTEIANSEDTLAHTVLPLRRAQDPAVRPVSTNDAATRIPGSAYGDLILDTATNLQALGDDWSANPFPLLRQVASNQQKYGQQIAAGLIGAIQHLPENLADLPVVIESAIQQLSTFDAAQYIQQIITTQSGFAQVVGTALNHSAASLIAGSPTFQTGLQSAFQHLLAGNYITAVGDAGQSVANLLVTGFDTSNLTFSFNFTTLTATATLQPVLLGALGDAFTIMSIPGQDAQFFTNLIPPSIPRQIAQNATNVLNTLTVSSISAELQVPLPNPAATTLSAFFGLPLVLTYATAGAPLATLDAMATSAQAFAQALESGNVEGVTAAIIDAPALALNAFLNGNSPIDTTFVVPTGLPAILPQSLGITLHLPADGILVPPHPASATLSLPGDSIPNFPFSVTILGTPFSGLVPLLINYLPQQLAVAIRPAP